MKQTLKYMVLVAGMAACQREHAESRPGEVATDIHAIGHRISEEDGSSWIARYQSQNPSSTHGFLFGKEVLTQLLDNDGAAGIWFMKGVDDAGDLKLVLYTANEEGNVLEVDLHSLQSEAGNNPADDSMNCPPFCPGSGYNARLADEAVKEVGSLIRRDTGDRWVIRFREGNGKQTLGFLYGRDLLEEMLSTQGAEGVWFYLAVKDDGQEAIVLYAADTYGNHFGSGASARGDGDTTPGDDGVGCPPKCPINYP